MLPRHILTYNHCTGLNWVLKDWVAWEYRSSGSLLCPAPTRDCQCLLSDTHEHWVTKNLHIYWYAANHIVPFVLHKMVEISVHKQLKSHKRYLHEVWAIYAAIWKLYSWTFPAGITLLWRCTCSPCGCLVSGAGYLSSGFWTDFLVLPLLFPLPSLLATVWTLLLVKWLPGGL